MDSYKYLTIVEWVKNYISENNLSEGSRFLSENELSLLHNVSRQTIRQALDVLEKQDIIIRVRGSGTFVKNTPRENLPSGRINVGVISTYFSDYIFPSIVTGIEKVLRKNNVGMLLSITRNRVYEESRALSSMLEQGVQGLIIEPSKSALPNQNKELYEKLKAENIPVVFFNAKYPWSDFPCVALDDTAAGKMAADYLFSMGHKKLCGIFAVDDIQGHQRYQGFLESCIKNGVEKAEENVIWYTTKESPRVFSLFGDRFTELITGSDSSRAATGVVCYNDRLAIDLINFCKGQGISVPEDISIVGIDDSKLAEICDIPLTSVRHPHRLLGEKAAETVLQLIKNQNMQTGDFRFAPEITERNSVKKV